MSIDPSNRTVLITGASRGIGASTARLLAERGARIAINYREKARRAELVANGITDSGGDAFAVRADITDPAAVAAMTATVSERFGKLDVLVLNASGGMERDVDPGYALRLNRDAQVALVEACLPFMPAGARIVFVTSHQAHFVDERPTMAAYEPVARSKRAGEDALRERIGMLRERGVDLVVVSGDMIEGTITATLLDRAQPGAIEARREAAGHLVTVHEFADEVANAVTIEAESGHTIYVGGADYLP
ncbi:SDR family oxidoreductase [Stackebrandtia soli]|uniref:SDR family oxidoreductase n=1 Tax=Stackebrandtia soli TaxID=1892856 RepID=UPI0039ED7E32